MLQSQNNEIPQREEECHCSLCSVLSETLTSETFVDSAALYQQLDDPVPDLLKNVGIPAFLNFYQAWCK